MAGRRRRFCDETSGPSISRWEAKNRPRFASKSRKSSSQSRLGGKSDVATPGVGDLGLKKWESNFISPLLTAVSPGTNTKKGLFYEEFVESNHGKIRLLHGFGN